MKNEHMRMQTTTMISSLKTFQAGLKMAAELDDGIIDAEEKQEIDAINSLTEKYISDLNEIVNGKTEDKGLFGIFRKNK